VAAIVLLGLFSSVDSPQPTVPSSVVTLTSRYPGPGKELLNPGNLHGRFSSRSTASRDGNRLNRKGAKSAKGEKVIVWFAHHSIFVCFAP
jgi:hypothetical protein